MRKHAAVILMTVVVLAAFGAFTGWAMLATDHIGDSWASLIRIWPYVAGGLLTVAALAGGLMWLAFYSANHGYDDRMDDDPR